MLLWLIQLIYEDLTGTSIATMFSKATGLSHTAFHTTGWAVLNGPKGPQALEHARLMIRDQLISSGAADGEAADTLARLEDEPIKAFIIFMMGYGLSTDSLALHALVQKLDDADRRLAMIFDQRDLQAAMSELGESSLLGREYSEPLNAAGMPIPPELETLDPWKRVGFQAHVRSAHMALSLMAAIDHEMCQWMEQVGQTGSWTGWSLFATLLAEADASPKRRTRPNDPIARLIDLTGAMAMRGRTRQWPKTRPKRSALGLQAELSGAIEVDGDRYIGNLRNSECNLTQEEWTRFVRSQLGNLNKPSSQPDETDVIAALMTPLLVAAHMFTNLMPQLEDSGHHNRTGWRHAYLTWWRRHAEARNRPTTSVGDRPPRWLSEP